MGFRSNRWLLIALLLVLSVVMAACGAGEPEAAAPGTYGTVNVQQAHEALSANNDAIMVDVRTVQEWAQTGVPTGAVLITLDEIAQRAPGALPKDQPVYLICNSGNRSRVAADELLKLGYTSVYSVDGGIQEWLRADLPTEPYTP